MMFNPGDKVLARARSMSTSVKYYPATIIRSVGASANGINMYAVSCEDGVSLWKQENELVLVESKQFNKSNELMEFLLS